LHKVAQKQDSASGRVTTTREAHMIEEMVLLRAVDGTWEGWRYMALEEFLQRLDLDAWKEGQLLIGTVLPRPREAQPDPSDGSERTAE
jgi:hypothetical protein